MCRERHYIPPEGIQFDHRAFCNIDRPCSAGILRSANNYHMSIQNHVVIKVPIRIMGKQFFGCLCLHIIDVHTPVNLIHDVLSPAFVRVRRPYEIFRLVYDRSFFACFQVFRVKAIFIILQAILVRRCALRLLREPVFQLRRALRCFYRLIDSDIFPDTVQGRENAVSIVHDFNQFSRFQIKAALAVFLLDCHSLPVLHRIDFF